MKKNKLLLIIAMICSIAAITAAMGLLIHYNKDNSTTSRLLGGEVSKPPERSNNLSTEHDLSEEDSSIKDTTSSSTENDMESQTKPDETMLTNTIIFEGNGNEAYETSDVSWFMQANDNDVITLVYTCTNADCAGWGILGWGATVDNVWIDGPSFFADSENATAILYSTFTVRELKDSLGIQATSDVSYLKLDTWNGGKIISLSIDSEEKKIKNAKPVPLIATQTNTKKATPVPTGLHGSYIAEFHAEGTYDIDIASLCPSFNKGDTISVTAVLEGDGSFTGCIGTSVGEDFSWVQNDYTMDSAGTTTWNFSAAATGDIVQIGIWYIGGSAVGIQSVSIEVTSLGEASLEYSLATQLLLEPQNIVFHPSSYCSNFTPGDTIVISADIYSDQLYNGSLCASSQNGAWNQSGKIECENGSSTWTLTVANAADYAELQIWWMSGPKLAIKSISVTVIAKGSTSSGSSNSNSSQTNNSSSDGKSTLPDSGIAFSGNFEIGDWNADLKIAASMFTDLKFDGTEKLIITYSSNNLDTSKSQYKLATITHFVELDSDYNVPFAASSTTKEIILTDAYRKIATDGLLIQGYNLIITEVKVCEAESEPEEDNSTLFSGSIESGNYNTALEIAASNFANLKFDGTNKLIITYYSTDTTTETETQFKIITIDNYTVLEDCTNVSLTTTPTTKEITLTDAFSQIAIDGLLIQGKNWTITDVSLDIVSTSDDTDKDEPIKTITEPINNSFSITDYCANFNTGDSIKVTAVLSSDNYFNGILGTDVNGVWTESSKIESTAGQHTWEASFENVTSDKIFINIWYMKGTYINLESLNITIQETTSSETSLLNLECAVSEDTATTEDEITQEDKKKEDDDNPLAESDSEEDSNKQDNETTSEEDTTIQDNETTSEEDTTIQDSETTSEENNTIQDEEDTSKTE